VIFLFFLRIFYENESYDIREEYKLRFWAPDDEVPNPEDGRINVHFVWMDKDLFLPAKLYFDEPFIWIDKVDDEFLRMECDYNSTKYYQY